MYHSLYTRKISPQIDDHAKIALNQLNSLSKKKTFPRESEMTAKKNTHLFFHSLKNEKITIRTELFQFI